MWTLITGAGSGIGRALALELAEWGHDLILCGRTASKLSHVAYEVEARSASAEVITVAVDLSDTADCERLAHRVGEVTGRLGAFVHCAGLGEPAADFASVDINDFQRALAVNVTAPMVLTQSLLALLRSTTATARVLMVGAGMDTKVQPGTASYGISKMALRRLVQQLGVELDPTRGDPAVALFQPGVVDTEGIRDHIDRAESLGLAHAEWLRDRLECGECLSPEQVARAIALALAQFPESDFHAAVLNAGELLDTAQGGSKPKE